MKDAKFLLDLIIELYERLKDTEFYIYCDYVREDGDIRVWTETEFKRFKVLYETKLDKYYFVVTEDIDNWPGYQRLFRKEHNAHRDEFEYWSVSSVGVN